MKNKFAGAIYVISFYFHSETRRDIIYIVIYVNRPVLKRNIEPSKGRTLKSCSHQHNLCKEKNYAQNSSCIKSTDQKKSKLLSILLMVER